jgi:hypothetical protein
MTAPRPTDVAFRIGLHLPLLLPLFAVACSPSTPAASDAQLASAPPGVVRAPRAPGASPVEPDIADASDDAPGFDGSAYGAWQPVTMPQFLPVTGILLTDGTVMFSDSAAPSRWWRLTPDVHGSYVNGTWSAMAQFPTGYLPTYFASAVLRDGRVIVVGGEFNENAQQETTLGAIYDPAVDLWTPVHPPSPIDAWYLSVGDAPSVVLADGTFMIGSIYGQVDALFDERTLTWTMLGAQGPDAGNGKADSNAEEGWTLLPSGKVLTLDVGNGTPDQNTELFDPATGQWSSAGNTPVLISDPNSYEIGPAILRPDGSVFAIGATGNTAVYDATGHWHTGPKFPSVGGMQLVVADGPAALLPNGNVLCAAGPGAYAPGVELFEFDGANLFEVSATPNSMYEPSYQLFFLVLPTGEVLAADGSQDVEVYTETGAPNPAWAPTITEAPSTVVRGTTYELKGTQFNGLSQGASYGDDYQPATNYPLVRITNDQSGHVFYGRTHDHSTMGVATGSAIVSTLFEASGATETGASHLVVVANGIASAPMAVTLQ